ncbi:MAG: 50S ribosomal protein L4 [bacterium]|nr:50S ribosomal protein L4 [bacterium]
MLETNLYNTEGEVVGKIVLKPDIFGQKVSMACIYEVVKSHLANLRRGCASTKTRGEVSGGGRKPWRQKGTGRARVGSIRSPIWRGGGIVFGPKPKSYKIRISSQVKRKALLSALATKVRTNNLIILDSLKLEEIKTSKMVHVLKNLQAKSPLFVLDKKDENIILSLRNIKGTKVVDVKTLGVYDILHHESLIMTKEALSRLEEASFA